MNIDFSKSMTAYGKSYKRATLFFPKHIKKQVFLLYAFVREADNIVDTPLHTAATADELEQMYQKTFAAYHSWHHTDSLLINEFATLCHTARIPRSRVEAFFDAMKADCNHTPYTTYEELQSYMYGSAEVIGLMMGKIIGMKEEGIEYAMKLGEAMQYTNFLRDIKEDHIHYGRIYIPQERLTPFGLSHDDIRAYCAWTAISESRKVFLQHEIMFTRTLYQESRCGIAYLSPPGRLPVYLSAALYEAILDRIEKHDYNVFAYDMHTTRLQKVRIVVEKSTWRLRKRHRYT